MKARTRRWPTPGGAALRSAIVPGWGQFATGHPRRGVLLVAAALLLATAPLLMAVALLRPLAGLLHVGFLDRLAASTWGTSVVGDALLDAIATANWMAIWRGVVVANVVLALGRALVALDAAAAARARRVAAAVRPAHLAGAMAGTLAAAIILIPHAAVGFAGYAVRPLLAQVLVPQARPAPVASMASAAT